MTAPLDPYAPPPWVTAERRPRGGWSWTGDLKAGLLSATVVVLLGAPVGLLWGVLAPRADVVKVAQGVNLATPETKSFIGADATLLLLGLAVGVICGVVAALLVRRRGPGVAVGLAVGSVLAALIAAAVGHRLGYSDYTALRDRGAVGSTGSAFLELRAKGALFGWPVGALLAFVAAGALRRAEPSQPPGLAR